MGTYDNLAQRRFWMLVVVGLVALSWLPWIDRLPADYVDSSLVQATAAFASARALNALLSVLQSVTLTLSAVGGAQVTVGELLEPLNQLVGQYALLMQWAIGSLVVQKVLLELVSDNLFKVALTVVGAACVMALWRPWPRWAGQLLRVWLLLALLRFALLVVVQLNAWVDQHFIAPQVQQDLALLAQLPQQVPGLEPVAPAPLPEPLVAAHEQAAAALVRAERLLALQQSGQSWWQRWWPSPAQREAERRVEQARAALAQWQQPTPETGMWQSLLQRLDQATQQVRRWTDTDQLLALRAQLDHAVDSVVRTMALFLLRTLLLPLLFLYLVSRVGKALWRRPPLWPAASVAAPAAE